MQMRVCGKVNEYDDESQRWRKFKGSKLNAVQLEFKHWKLRNNPVMYGMVYQSSSESSLYLLLFFCFSSFHCLSFSSCASSRFLRSAFSLFPQSVRQSLSVLKLCSQSITYSLSCLPQSMRHSQAFLPTWGFLWRRQAALAPMQKQIQEASFCFMLASLQKFKKTSPNPSNSQEWQMILCLSMRTDSMSEPKSKPMQPQQQCPNSAKPWMDSSSASTMMLEVSRSPWIGRRLKVKRVGQKSFSYSSRNSSTPFSWQSFKYSLIPSTLNLGALSFLISSSWAPISMQRNAHALLTFFRKYQWYFSMWSMGTPFRNFVSLILQPGFPQISAVGRRTVSDGTFEATLAYSFWAMMWLRKRRSLSSPSTAPQESSGGLTLRTKFSSWMVWMQMLTSPSWPPHLPRVSMSNPQS